MATWILQPRDTLLLRDARPSSEGAGGLRSLDFPWPSSLAGLIRTRIGSAKSGHFDLEVNKAKQIPVRGPLLVELTANGEVAANDEGVPMLLVPAPCDCVWYRAEPTAKAPKTHFVRRRLEPVNYREQFPGFETDLDTKPYGTARTKYLLRHLSDDATGKPVTGAAFWRWNDFQTWLTNPVSEARFPENTEPGEVNHARFRDFGQPALVREQRTHVRIDAAAQTAEDGMLFVTESLRFARTQKGAAPLELGLLFSCEYQDPERPLRPGLVTFGGERKLSALASTTATLPNLPPTLQTTLERNRADGKSLARVVLLTPALFKEGFAPEWIGNETVKVVAAAVPRPQVVSGWDHELVPNKEGKLEQKGPKRNRRMAPAGSVYWVELPQDLDIEKWLKSVWMQCLSNQMTDQDAQYAKDGFGLCAVGVG